MFKWLFKKKGCAKHMNNKLEVIGIDHGWSMSTSSLRSEDYNQWYEDLQAKYPAELTEDGKAIPTL